MNTDSVFFFLLFLLFKKEVTSILTNASDLLNMKVRREKARLRTQDLMFPDGEYNMYAAFYGSWAKDKIVVFRVRTDRVAHERAKEKGIFDYDRLVKLDGSIPYHATLIAAWIKGHPQQCYQLLNEVFI